MGKDILQAPWTAEEVANLVERQRYGTLHPYTHFWQGNNQPENCGALLLPTQQGWICPTRGCGYTQDWCYAADAHTDWVAQQAAWERLRVQIKEGNGG